MPIVKINIKHNLLIYYPINIISVLKIKKNIQTKL
jgi:hypothetical protein